MEEIIVRSDAEKKLLQFTIHWKGGTHTQIEIERPRQATETATSMEALDIIRRMAVRSGDDQIASVLKSIGLFNWKGEAVSQIRVATARGAIIRFQVKKERRPIRRESSLSEAAPATPVPSTIWLTFVGLTMSGYFISHSRSRRSMQVGNFPLKPERIGYLVGCGSSPIPTGRKTAKIYGEH